MEEVLRIQGLSKHYGPIKALSGLDLTIHKGEIWGLLGPNGSGKTTTLAIILNIVHQNSGSFEWFGGRFGPHYRRQIGAILETPNFYPYLNALENLKIIQHIKQSYSDPLDEFLEMVKLSHRKKSKFSSYSLGMKQRLAIAATLIGDPDVLIFDEPTNGLDPMGIIEIRNTLIRIGQSGKTILMASHILDEVEKVCDYVAILKSGKLIKSGRVGTILADQFIYQLSCTDNTRLRSILENDQHIDKIIPQKDYLEAYSDHEVPGQYFNQLAFDNGLVLHHLTAKKPSLEQEFISLVNQP